MALDYIISILTVPVAQGVVQLRCADSPSNRRRCRALMAKPSVRLHAHSLSTETGTDIAESWLCTNCRSPAERNRKELWQLMRGH